MCAKACMKAVTNIPVPLEIQVRDSALPPAVMSEMILFDCSQL